ncbi:MAG: hypothetical protein AAGA85_03525 [Bacteroidota bacterium]
MKRLAIIFLLCACGPSKDDAILHEAAELHDQAVEIAFETASRISQMKGVQQQLTEAGRDSLDAIAKDLQQWYEVVVEVPGHEHDHAEHSHAHNSHGDDHDHAHDHDHDHSSEPNYLEGLSAQEILEIQAELKRDAEYLQGRLKMIESTLSE